jgi:NAD(P)-dependent dehydrogenase (short-subunit alcohol dehydrogenase family)
MPDPIRPSSLLQDRAAIVTGGGSGIGRATCLRLAAAGVRVCVVDLDAERAEDTQKAIEMAGDAPGGTGHLALGLDVRSEGDMNAMARRAAEQFGRIDLLVHCAGILRGKGRPPRMLSEMTTEEWDDVLGTNLRGTFLADRAVLPAMIRQRSGLIVNLSSTSGRIGRAFDSAYCASKFGVIGLSESLAEEVRSFGIKVMVVCPDAVDTPLWEQNGPIRAPENALDPDRVAELIAYLAALPPDTILQNIVIQPFATRRRKKRAPGGSEGSGDPAKEGGAS